MKQGIRPLALLVVFIKALVLALALLYLGEYFGWRSVGEAGGLVGVG